LRWKMLVYFMAIGLFYGFFGVFWGHLVYVVYGNLGIYFPRLVML
jgi:hypothetical protein